MSYTGGHTDLEYIVARDDAAALCSALGHYVEVIDPPINVDLFQQARLPLWSASIAGTLFNLQRTHARLARKEDFEPFTWKRAEFGHKVSGAQALAAREAMFTLHRQMAGFMENYDVILTPSAQRPPPPPGLIDLQQTSEEAMAEFDRLCAFTWIANITGQPSMSIPLFWTEDNMPIGSLFTGRFGEEALLFSLASQLERARPWFSRLPHLLR